MLFSATGGAAGSPWLVATSLVSASVVTLPSVHVTSLPPGYLVRTFRMASGPTR